jgi:preprotein translocase subunit YajC
MHLDSLNVLLAQAPAATGAQGSPLGFIVPMGLIVVMMYFMMIRPQQQRAKQQAKLLGALKSGDRVVTASGIVGIVLTVKDKAVPPSVSLRSADAKFEVTKSSISEIIEAGSTTES